MIWCGSASPGLGIHFFGSSYGLREKESASGDKGGGMLTGLFLMLSTANEFVVSSGSWERAGPIKKAWKIKRKRQNRITRIIMLQKY